MDYCNDLRFVRVNASGIRTERSVTGHFFKDYYGLQLVFEGDIYACTGDNPPEYASGPVAFITYPGVPFTYGSPPGKSRNIAYICFSGKRVEEYIRSGLLPLREKQLFIPLGNSQQIFSTLEQLLGNLAIPGNALHHARAVLLLESLLLQLHEVHTISGNHTNPYSSRLHDLCAKIADHPEREWDFRNEAAILQVSYAHFRRLFTKETGHSPKQYLLECRMRKVERMLTTENARISEIADLCGFDNVFHLYRVFKKHRALAPSRFRKIYGLSGQ